ncbi:hypothetical protein AVEN_243236-1 [Araneus ventricosus]|uniref:Uncharacterized protein n=1 Tax=Araneus ventricosus TaxID=182803 RepID=A0A4Y2TB13_ARAVE|nr:hypothetical protein AVEN_243236-1 [Araneus ventricosus]
MNEKTYYFHDLIRNDSLRHVSQKAKKALQEIDKVVKTFQKYYKVLSRESPRHFKFLMTLNDKSLSWNDSCSSCSGENQHDYTQSERKPSQQLTTSMKINPNVPDFSLKHLLLDQAKKENYEPVNFGICNSTRHKTENISPNKKYERILCSSADKTIANGPKFVQPFISKEAKILESPEVNNKEHFRSAIKDTMTANLASYDKQSVSPSEMSKMTDKSHENNEKYLSSAEITLTSSFTTQNKDFVNYVKVVKMSHNHRKDNQEYVCPVHKAKMPDNPDTKSKESVWQYENTKMLDNRDTDIDEYAKPCKKPDDKRPYNQESIVSDEIILKMTNSTEGSQESSSFVKRAEKTIISTIDDKMTTSPKVEQKIHESTEEKDIPSCARRNSVLFGSVPKVKHFNGVIEIVMVASCKADENPSPKSPSLSPKNCKIDHKAEEGKGSAKDNIRSAVAQDLEVTISSTSINGRCSRLLDASSPRSVENTNIQGKDNTVLLGKYLSSDSLMKAMSSDYQSGVALPPPIINCSDPNILLEYMTKFVKFCEKRVNSMREIYNSFLHFKNNLLFLYSYVKDIEYIIHNIPFVDMEYSTEEFYKIKLIEITSKLIKKLSSFAKDVQTDITVLNQCFQRIQDLKSKNEPFIMKGMPIVSFNFLRMYAQNLKEIWKKMDNMVTCGYSRSSLFFNTAHDFERLITNFVKCLIIVGILKPRSNTKK